MDYKLISTPSGPLLVDKDVYEAWAKEERVKNKLISQRWAEEERLEKRKTIWICIGLFIIAVISMFGFCVWKSGRKR